MTKLTCLKSPAVARLSMRSLSSAVKATCSDMTFDYGVTEHHMPCQQKRFTPARRPQKHARIARLSHKSSALRQRNLHFPSVERPTPKITNQGLADAVRRFNPRRANSKTHRCASNAM